MVDVVPLDGLTDTWTCHVFARQVLVDWFRRSIALVLRVAASEYPGSSIMIGQSSSRRVMNL